MKFESVIFKSVLAAASIVGASAASAANPTALNPRQALDAEIKEQQKVSRKFRDTVEFLERRLNDDDVKTNGTCSTGRDISERSISSWQRPRTRKS